MQLLIQCIALVLLAVLWLVIATKVFVVILRVVRPKFFPPWFARIYRFAPSWRLFGQVGATFDLYGIFGDELKNDSEHFHSPDGPRRKWYHPLINPYSRYRYLFRELMQVAMFHHLSQIPDRPTNQRAVRILEQIARHEVRASHPDDYQDRRVTLYVVFDRGHFSSTPAEVKLTLGPYNS